LEFLSFLLLFCCSFLWVFCRSFFSGFLGGNVVWNKNSLTIFVHCFNIIKGKIKLKPLNISITCSWQKGEKTALVFLAFLSANLLTFFIKDFCFFSLFFYELPLAFQKKFKSEQQTLKNNK